MSDGPANGDPRDVPPPPPPPGAPAPRGAGWPPPPAPGPHPAYPYPGYGAASPPPAGPGGLAIAALVVGIIAFLSGLVPFVGLGLAVVGLVLSIIAVRRPRGRGLSIAGIVLSAIAFLTGVVVLVVTLLVLPAAYEAADRVGEQGDEQVQGDGSDGSDAAEFDEAEFSRVSGQRIETPCWEYEGPVHFTNNISAGDTAACYGKLELWGEADADGNVTPTGVGAIHGQVGVEPVRVSTAESYAPGTDPEAVVDAIAESYFAPQGEIESLHEPTTLDGVPADITRLESDAELTETKAFITAYAPAPYEAGDEPVQLFIISIVTPYDNGDELIQQVLDTWRWR
jgi:hypothetical protein